MEVTLAPGFRAVRLLWGVTQPAMKVEIHNKSSDIELVDPLYFSDGAICYDPLDQKVAPHGMLSVAFRVNLTRITFKGVLICRLRKGINSNQQSSADATNIDEKWSNYVQLLVGWKVDRFKGPRVYMLLGEHGEKLTWTEDKLKKTT
jgi:hypothetical protein